MQCNPNEPSASLRNSLTQPDPSFFLFVAFCFRLLFIFVYPMRYCYFCIPRRCIRSEPHVSRTNDKNKTERTERFSQTEWCVWSLAHKSAVFTPSASWLKQFSVCGGSVCMRIPESKVFSYLWSGCMSSSSYHDDYTVFFFLYFTHSACFLWIDSRLSIFPQFIGSNWRDSFQIYQI